MNTQDAERQELERAIELLGRSTRPGRLLEYLGSKYFQQQAEQLSEFNIATAVFGRSEKNFDSTADAVVRVEAHRLRKKLKEIYEKDSRAQGLQISLPAGSYVPKFTAAAEPLPTSPEPVPPGDEPADSSAGVSRRLPTWAWSLAIVVVVSIAIAALVTIDRSPPGTTAASARETAPDLAPAAATKGELTELHIMSGYSGSEVIDNSGVRWTPDRYFAGGGQWSRDSGFVRGTSRPFLFTNWRTGEFGYDIPMARGVYEMRLYFVSSLKVGDEKLSGFNIALNGKPLLDAFDVIMSANGADVAEEQVFRDVTPDENGFVRLWFSNQVGSPMLNGLELTPGTPGKLKPIRIITQATSFVDHNGQRWRADDYYQNGITSNARRKVTGTQDPELFSAERFGHFSYAIPVDRRGRYTVVLHFAEFYYGPQLPGGGGAGSRVFHVYGNGQTLLRNFDIYKEGGSLRVITKTFPNLEPSAQGKINLMFEPVINNATVSGIEVLDTSTGASQ
jgi:hypothetical protein